MVQKVIVILLYELLISVALLPLICDNRIQGYILPLYSRNNTFCRYQLDKGMKCTIVSLMEGSAIRKEVVCWDLWSFFR